MHVQNEMRDEMATPIAQSAVDEERDRMVAEVPDEVDSALDDASTVTESNVQGNQIRLSIKFSVGSVPGDPSKQPLQMTSSRFAILHGALRSAASTGTVVVPAAHQPSRSGATGGAGGSGGGAATPQSPIISEWSRWMTAPNVTGGDLLTELEALRKPATEGLSTTEVAFLVLLRL